MKILRGDTKTTFARVRDLLDEKYSAMSFDTKGRLVSTEPKFNVEGVSKDYGRAFCNGWKSALNAIWYDLNTIEDGESAYKDIEDEMDAEKVR